MADLTKYSSIKDVPSDEVFQTSSDGSTLVLKDGTRVTDELIAQAKKEVKKPKAEK